MCENLEALATPVNRAVVRPVRNVHRHGLVSFDTEVHLGSPTFG